MLSCTKQAIDSRTKNFIDKTDVEKNNWQDEKGRDKLASKWYVESTASRDDKRAENGTFQCVEVTRQ